MRGTAPAEWPPLIMKASSCSRRPSMRRACSQWLPMPARLPMRCG